MYVPAIPRDQKKENPDPPEKEDPGLLLFDGYRRKKPEPAAVLWDQSPARTKRAFIHSRPPAITRKPHHRRDREPRS